MENLQVLLEDRFINACRIGHLEAVEKLTQPIKGQVLITYPTASQGFRWACLYGHLKIVQYMLKNFHVSIHTNNDCALDNCSRNGHLDIVIYLMESPELSEHIKLSMNSVQWTMVNERHNVLEYFIYQQGLELSSDLENFINKNIDNTYWKNTIYRLFSNKKQYYNLQKNIALKNQPDKICLTKI